MDATPRGSGRHDDPVSLAEASRRLGLEVSWLRRLAARGVLRASRVGTTWVTTSGDIERFETAQLGRAPGGHHPAPRSRWISPPPVAAGDDSGDRWAREGPRVSSPILVDRRSELGRLLDAAASPPSVSVVFGEAGVGKTRLVTELVERCHSAGRLALIGRCHPLQEPFLLAPFIDALRDAGSHLALSVSSPVAGALRPLLPELADRLPPEPATHGDPQTQRHLAFRAVREVLAALGPCVVVIEDLQWADPGTAELLRFLVGQLPPVLALVATCRREDMPARSPVLTLVARPPAGVTVGVHHLAPLTRSEVRELAAAILQTDPVSADVAEHLHARTGGLPFAVEELLRLIRDRPAAASASGRAARRLIEGLPVPESVRAFVLDRVAALSADGQRAVIAAAVLAAGATTAEVSAVAGLTAARAHRAVTDALLAAVFVEVQSGQYDFRHSLARDAVYDALPGPERERLHLRAAHMLERRDPRPVAQLARHYSRCQRAREWVECAEAAADLAATRFDDWTAARFLDDALGVPAVAPATRARLAVKLARASLSAHTLQRAAVAHLETVVSEPGLDRPLRGQVRANLGVLLTEVGDAAAGYREQAAAVRELGRRPDLASIVMGNLALPGAVTGDEPQQRRWLRRALDRAEESGNPQVQFTLATVAALVPVWLGDAGAWEAVDAIPWDADSADAQRQLLWLGSQLPAACYYLGQYRRAGWLLADAGLRAAHTVWDRFRPLRDITTILLAWAAGDWLGLEARAADLGDAVADELPPAATAARAVHASLRATRGDLAGAERDLVACADAALNSGVMAAIAETNARLARVCREAGDAHGALRFAGGAMAMVAGKGTWAWAGEVAPEAVAAMLECGRKQEAVDLAARLARGLRGRDAPLAWAGLILCRALIAEAAGRHASAVRFLGQAERAYAALPRPYDAARIAARCGTLLLTTGDASGSEHLLAALARFDALGATHDADRARQVLRQFSITVAPRHGGGRRSFGSALSPQEERVAELAAAGRSNTEIAHTLFLSQRTVEHHLTAVRRKLGIRSRAALVATWLARGGSSLEQN